MAIGDFTIINENCNPAINFIPTGTNKFMCVAWGGNTNCQLRYENALAIQAVALCTSNDNKDNAMMPCKFVFDNTHFCNFVTNGGPPADNAYSLVLVEE